MSSDPAPPSMSLRRVSVGDSELQVFDAGSGLPVVFLHGFPLDSSMWEAQLAPLARRHRVIAPDLRGFGGSGFDAGPAAVTSMEQMADDTAALLAALDVDRPVVLCGLSMGGYVAFEFWRTHPSRLAALVLCDTRAGVDTPEAAQARHETADRALREGMRPLAEGMVPKLFAAETIAEQPQLVERMRERMLATSAEGAAAALRGMAARRDFRPRLGQIALPALVVVGEHDGISPVDEMREMAAALPHARFEVIAGAGHMAPFEKPDAFNAALGPLLAELESA